MKAVNFMIYLLVLPVVLASTVHAQTFENLSLEIEGRSIRTTGGEQASVSTSSGALVIGRTTSAVLSHMPSMCGLGIRGGETHAPGAISGWTVDVIPIKVDGESIRFRLRWVRSRENGKESSAPGGDLELTLKPGESLPLDIVPLSPSAMAQTSCGMTATVLRVAARHWPWHDNDRRLLATELWLIERLPDGTERNQSLSVRGMFNQRTPFYFDTITDGGSSLDFFGEFTTTPDGASMVMKLESRSRLVQGGQSSLILPMGGNRFGARRVESTIRLKPNDIADVELPRLSENEAGAFANRRYSIRVRTRQIR